MMSWVQRYSLQSCTCLLPVHKHVTVKGTLRKFTSLFSMTRLSWLLYDRAKVTRIMICNPVVVLAIVYGAFFLDRIWAFDSALTQKAV